MPAAPDHSDPQFSSASVILAIFDLCTNLTPEIGEELLSHHSSKQLVSKTGLGWGWGRTVRKKGEGKFISWLFGIALALLFLTNKTGLGGNHIKFTVDRI